MSAVKRNRFKTIATIVALLVIVSAIVLASVVYLRQDKIKNLLVGELNKHLTTEVSVNQIDLSIVKSFPFVSLVLNDVVIKPPKNFPEAPPLMKAKLLMLRFNIISIITGKYTIHSIYISNASLSFHEDGNGRDNFSILKSTGTTTGKEVNFDIRKLTLQQSTIYYRNTGRADDIALSVNQLVMKGEFQSKQFTLKLKGDLLNEKLMVGNTTILPPGKAVAESVVEINTIKKVLDFKKALLVFEDIPAEFRGRYTYGYNSLIDFSVTSIKGEISRILKIIPQWVADYFTPYSPEGVLMVRGSLKGPSGQPEQWIISATGDISSGKLSYDSGKLNFTHIETNASLYYAGKKSSEVLKLKKISGKLGSGRFEGTATIRNFSKPHGDLVLHLNTDISELDSLLTNENFTRPQGRLSADIRYNGPFTGNDRIDRNIKGEASFSDAGFMYKKEVVSNMNGAVAFADNKLHMDGFTCRIGNSDFTANGFIENLTGYIMGGDRRNVNASLSLYSDKLILEDLIGLVSTTDAQSTTTSIFPPNVTLTSVVNINSLTYKKLSTQNITGTFSLKDDILRGSNISIKALGGNISANGLINGRYGNRAQIITKASFRNVDINQLFYQFDNFGQKSLVSENLKGTGDATVDFSTSLYRDFTINTASVEAIADLEIRNGELNDFEPLQALSRFLDTKELRNVRFATLKNRIEIINKTVLIPRMEINSSALNLVGYGTHTFGNNIDYHVNMLLSDVLRAKRKKSSLTEQVVEDDGTGKPRLFLRLTGPIDDPVVKYDTQAVGRKIATDLKNEKQVLKEALNKEFGKKPTNQPATGTRGSQSTEFQIEWDETK